MGDVVNLNRFRKRKARAAKQKRAEQNRRLHGRSKAERAQEAARKKRLEQKLAGALLIPERVALDDVPTARAEGPAAPAEPQADDSEPDKH